MLGVTGYESRIVAMKLAPRDFAGGRVLLLSAAQHDQQNHGDRAYCGDTSHDLGRVRKIAVAILRELPRRQRDLERQQYRCRAEEYRALLVVHQAARVGAHGSLLGNEIDVVFRELRIDRVAMGRRIPNDGAALTVPWKQTSSTILGSAKTPSNGIVTGQKFP